MKNLKGNMLLKTILMVAIFILVVVAAFFVYKKATTVNTYKEIKFNELKKIVDSGEQFILFIGSDTCSHCTVYKETLNSKIIPTYHVLVYYIDTNKLSEEELGYINARFFFSATPTTIFVKAGSEEVSERVLKKEVGSLNSKVFGELIKKYNFIKE